MVTAGLICAGIFWAAVMGYAWCLCRCKAQADEWEYREDRWSQEDIDASREWARDTLREWRGDSPSQPDESAPNSPRHE